VRLTTTTLRSVTTTGRGWHASVGAGRHAHQDEDQRSR
jgi:hypothetical protein